jgi:thiamine-monophosphate kinase
MKRTELNELGEFGLINHLTKKFSLQNSSSLKGVGDDAAVIQYGSGKATLISTDMLVENVHFDLIYTPLKHLGYKAVVVNLSDIYAMNAIPRQILVSISMSNKYSVEALEEIYEGMRLACEHYGVDLVGGDTTSSVKGMTLSITAVGEQEPSKIVYRNGAKPGDLLCVTGNLGAAYVGLQLLEREKQVFLANPKMQPVFDGQDYLISRLLKPEARKDIIEFFAEASILPSSMIDISDGLSSEVLHLCNQSKTGAIVEEMHVPVSELTYHKALDFNTDPIVCALHGGEDYELLFTINPKDADKIKYNLEISIIGEIIPASDGVKLQTKAGKFHDLTAQGWKHY